MNSAIAANPQPPTQSLKARISTVEFWRLIFTILVCVYHFEIFFVRRSFLVSGTSAVEFFFVLAGFTMAMSAKRSLSGRLSPMTPKEAHAKALDFVKKKLKGIYPILLTYMVFWVILVLLSPPPAFSTKTETILNTEWDWLLLVGTPFGFNNGFASNIPMWFLTALILIGYVYTYAIYRHYDFVRFAAPALGVICYVFFALYASSTLDHSIPVGFLNAGMVKAVAEMSLGIAVFGIYEHLTSRKISVLWQFLLSMLEYYAIYRFFALTFGQNVGMDNYRRIVYILIIVLLSFSNVTVMSRILNRHIWEYLGKLSLAMYISHYTLIQVYFRLISAWKSLLEKSTLYSPGAENLLKFLQNTGGVNARGRSAPMSVKDAVLYMILVTVSAVFIMLVIALFKNLVYIPLKKKLIKY